MPQSFIMSVMGDIISRLRTAASEVLPRSPVLFAYLYGSWARGMGRQGSDVDVGVYLDDSIQEAHYLGESLRLAQVLADASGVGGIEVLVLNEADLPLRGRVVSERVILYSIDDTVRVRFETRSLDDFLDFELRGHPLRAALLRRMAGGSA